MDAYWLWWIAALAIVAAELMTGTVYLLMVALGLVAGGVIACAGQGAVPQFLVAAMVAVAGCVWVQRRRASVPAQPESQRNANVQIDVGQTVQVDVWQIVGSQRTAQVQYRGAVWSARLDVLVGTSADAVAGSYRIAGIDGNTLLLQLAK
jgi:membrane protein implicated in regulation of membrane protease activity